MKNRRNYYRVLRVDRDAPPEVIQASYRTLMQRLRMHPDLGGDEVDAALVIEAFSTLSNRMKRAAYDRTLDREALRHHAQTPPQAPAPPPRSPGVVCSFCESVCDAGADRNRDAVCPACGSPLCPALEHRTGEGSRRAMERLPRELPVSFRRRSRGTSVWRGTTKDLSLNGMRLVAPVKLSVGERVSLEADMLSAVAVVRSVRGWECGLEFVTLRFARERGVLVSTVA